jgi:hypothetical protein
MTLVFKPIGILSGVLAGLLGKKIFGLVWGLIDNHDPRRRSTAGLRWGNSFSR